MSKSEEILSFWFGQARQDKFWFGGGAEADAEIRGRWEADVRRAVAGEYDAWAGDPRSCLALILLLDQFSLNIFRDEARSHLQSMMAVPFALKAIARGFDQQVPPIYRVFYYMPIEHSEDRHLQRYSVALFERLVAEGPADERERWESYLRFARKHQAVIDRFGRFPYWNDLLGRPSTPEEEQWLMDGGPDY